MNVLPACCREPRHCRDSILGFTLLVHFGSEHMCPKVKGGKRQDKRTSEGWAYEQEKPLEPIKMPMLRCPEHQKPPENSKHR